MKKLLTIVAMVGLVATGADALQYRFNRTDAGTDNVWTNEQNWTQQGGTPDILPGAGDHALINKDCVLDAAVPYATYMNIATEGNNQDATLDINSGGSLTNTSWTQVGGGGGGFNTGQLNVNSGGSFEAQGALSIATQNATNTGVVTVGGTLVAATVNVGSGSDGDGTLTVVNGGDVTASGTLIIGNASGSEGTVTVQTGGVLTTSNGVKLVSNAGATGTLNIHAGGTLHSAGTTEFDIGNRNNDGGMATVLVEGTLTSDASNFDIAVGVARQGTVTVAAGGVLTSANSIRLAVIGDSSWAKLVVQGAMTNLAGSIQIGHSSSACYARMEVTSDGAEIYTAGNLYVREYSVGGTGELVITAGDVNVEGTAVLAGTASIEMSGGSMITDWVDLKTDGIFTLSGGTLRLRNNNPIPASADGYFDLKGQGNGITPGEIVFESDLMSEADVQALLDGDLIINSLEASGKHKFQISTDGAGDVVLTVVYVASGTMITIR